MRKYRKANWEELQIGKTYYDPTWDKGIPTWHAIKLVDKTENKITYRYKDGFGIYITKSNYNEFYIYTEDEQLYLNL